MPAPAQSARQRHAGQIKINLRQVALGQSQERNHPEQDLINPRGRDFYLATSGDKNGSGAIVVTQVTGVAPGVPIAAFVMMAGVRS
jgi:hypothetical protein